MSDATAAAKRQAAKAEVVLFRHDPSGGVQHEFLSLLTEGYAVKVVGALHGGLVVERNHAWWLLTDNGGELNVERINDMMARSVASTAHGATVDGETMAYRVAMVMAGEAIDYGFRFQPAKKAKPQRGATKAQLEYRKRLFAPASPSIHDDVAALAVVR